MRVVGAAGNLIGPGLLTVRALRQRGGGLAGGVGEQPRRDGASLAQAGVVVLASATDEPTRPEKRGNG